MFLFYHSDQKESNQSYFKGILFESLLAQYLNASGYDVEIRRKHNSLEYDIEGEDRPTRFKIIGEAKAHNAPMSGQDLSAFVGKLIPLGLINKQVRGLFLSTSSLTAEAEDYYSQIRDLGVEAKTGKGLHNAIKQALGLPDYNSLSEQLTEQGYNPQSSHILTTNHGVFVVVIAGSIKSTAPAYFAAFQPNGRPLADKEFLSQLSDSTSELKSLQALVGSGAGRASFAPPDKVHERTIARGLAVGMDWTDYRFPAAPAFFIGRREFVKRLLDHVYTNEHPNVLQVKSRSGVGKSSILAYAEKEFSNHGIATELHDARDIRSILDVYSLIQRFTGSASTPQDFQDVEEQLRALAESTCDGHAVFMVDQFESTFSNAEVFLAYESLASSFLKFFPRLYLCLARKNDQITTYDDSKVSLERLNSISRSYELRDFSQGEAAELMERINEHAVKPVKKEVLAYVLEFAQGFPWLVKRTMAHIVRLTSSGFTQGELFAAGLKLDDLFEEELEGLDEIERAYLTRIAARLPADYHQLQSYFDEDPLLPKILDRLTQSRLIRLTGATYDTYNDVFKEYLVFQKLPEFRQALIYRMSPSITLSVCRWAIEREAFTAEELENELDVSRGSAFNRIRELSVLNLIRRDGAKWRVPRTVVDVYHQGRLGEYVRRQLADNDLVANLINKVAQSEITKEENLPIYLKQQFPFIEASDKTWSYYADYLRSWLGATRLLDFDHVGNLSIPIEDRYKIVEGLGNLTNFAKGSARKSSTELFFPITTWRQVESALQKLLDGYEVTGREEIKALQDLKNGGWLQQNNLTVSSVDQFKSQAEEMFRSGAYDELWQAAESGEPLSLVVDNIMPASFSSETVRWKIKRLLSWAKALQIIPAKNYPYLPKRSSRT